MKLATYKDGSRDGQLVVVSRDLSTAHYATGIAERLQQVLDDWNFLSPQLQDLYETLNHGKARHAFPFDPARCMAPLPRAFQWVQGACYPGQQAWWQSLRAQDAAEAGEPMRVAMTCAGDEFLGPRESLPQFDDTLEADFSAQLAVITGDVVRGASAEQALEGVRLVMLANAMHLRALQAGQAAHGLALGASCAAAAFSPVAVTTDELGDAWKGGRVHLPVQVSLNGRKFGLIDAATDMTVRFGALIAQVAAHRALRAGTLIGTGTLGNRGVEGSKGRTDWPKGFGSLAEKRQAEVRQDGQASSPYLRAGDAVRIEMKGRDGQSVCGVIEQTVGAPVPVAAEVAAD